MIAAAGVIIFAVFFGLLLKIDGQFFTADISKLQFASFTLKKPITQCVNGKPEIILSWTALKDASKYVVQRKDEQSKSFADNIAAVAEQKYEDKAVLDDAIYFYRVKAIKKRGNKIFTNSVKAVAPHCSSLSEASSLKWGAYVGWREDAASKFESLVGKKMDIQAIFTHWGNEKDFPSQYTAGVREEGKTLLIFWEAMDYNSTELNDSRFSYDAILRGDWDSYFEEFSAGAKNYKGPIILIPFEEMNCDGTPWAGALNNNSPAKHILAYRHIHKFFREAKNVKFGWTVNNDSIPDTPENQIENYYPGDEYVDYAGVNGFNFGNPWQSFDEVFEKPLKKLSIYNKPIFIFSMASAQGPKKADWIREGLGLRIKLYPNIIGWIWFNEDKERAWQVNSDNASLESFKSVIP